MRKIPTLFQRDWPDNPRYVTRQVTPGCEWVMAGEGIATRKYDGTCVMFDGTDWFARREIKGEQTRPEGFIEVEYDLATDKYVGWEPAHRWGFYKYLTEALAVEPTQKLPGTYELCGPKVNGNHERLSQHWLIAHHPVGDNRIVEVAVLTDVPRTYDGLARWLHAYPFEGIVFQHPDGRMVKIKQRDFVKP